MNDLLLTKCIRCGNDYFSQKKEKCFYCGYDQGFEKAEQAWEDLKDAVYAELYKMGRSIYGWFKRHFMEAKK